MWKKKRARIIENEALKYLRTSGSTIHLYFPSTHCCRVREVKKKKTKTKLTSSQMESLLKQEIFLNFRNTPLPFEHSRKTKSFLTSFGVQKVHKHISQIYYTHSQQQHVLATATKQRTRSSREGKKKQHTKR